jgi:glycogen phosphorylase
LTSRTSEKPARPWRDALLTHGDRYMHLADLRAYRKVTDLYARPDAWTRTAILNVASSGKFSSDRTIAQYAAEVWDAQPCPVT